MVNPGAFQGLRKEFLMGEKPAYALAVKDSYIADAVSVIFRRYFKRFPITLDHNTDPTEEHLAAVDDNAPDPEPVEPDPSDMTTQEYAAALEEIKKRNALLEYCKSQIKRWLAYQYTKDNDVRSQEIGSSNPYTVMTQKLTGKANTYPRIRTAVNVWRKSQRETIDAKLKGEVELGIRLNRPIPKERYATMRDKIARELFAELPEEIQRDWRSQAHKEYLEAVEVYKREMEAEPSTDPAERQRSIQGLTQFMQPILDMVCKATGWKATFIAGGPEPAHEGRLNVISVHSGTTSGEVKMNFGRAERAGFKSQIIPIFGKFLQKCYTPEECRSRALAIGLGYVPVASLEADNEDFNITTVALSSSTISDSTVPSPMLSSTSLTSQVTAPRQDPVAVNSIESININNPFLSTPNDNPFPFETDDFITSPLNSPPPFPPISRHSTPMPSPNSFNSGDKVNGMAKDTDMPLREVQPPVHPTVKPAKKSKPVPVPVVVPSAEIGPKRTRTSTWTQSVRSKEAEEHCTGARKGKKSVGQVASEMKIVKTRGPKGKKTAAKRTLEAVDENAEVEQPRKRVRVTKAVSRR